MMDRFSAELMRGSLDLMVLSRADAGGSSTDICSSSVSATRRPGGSRYRPERCIRCFTDWKPKSLIRQSLGRSGDFGARRKR